MTKIEKKEEGTEDPNIVKGEDYEVKVRQQHLQALKTDPLFKVAYECFEKPGLFIYPVAHESMGQAYGPFQNYLLAKIVDKLEYKIPKVEIKTIHDKDVSEIIERGKEKKEEDEKELSKTFDITEKGDMKFRLFRFNPNTCLLYDARGGIVITTGTEDSAETAKQVTDYLRKTKSNIVNDLKVLSLAAYKYCENHIKEQNEAVKGFSKNWRNFLAGALELEEHFKHLAEAMNKITEERKYEMEVPKFSVYRILIGAFIDTYYSSCKMEIVNHFKELLKDLNEYTIRYYTIRFTKEKCNKDQKFDELSYFEDEKVLEDFLKPVKGKGPNYRTLLNSIRDVSEYITSILDMYINEKNVHYVQNFCFVSEINKRDSEDLENIIGFIKEAFDSACKTIENDERMKKWDTELLIELIYQYQIIFPPSFLRFTEGPTKDYLYDKQKEILKELVRRKIKEYKTKEFSFKPKEEQPKEEQTEDQRYKDYKEYMEEAEKYTIKIIKKIPEVKDKSEDEHDRMFKYILQEGQRVVEGIVYYKRKKMMHNFADKAIVKRNTELRGKLSKEIDQRYTMKGMGLYLSESLK